PPLGAAQPPRVRLPALSPAPRGGAAGLETARRLEFFFGAGPRRAATARLALPARVCVAALRRPPGTSRKIARKSRHRMDGRACERIDKLSDRESHEVPPRREGPPSGPSESSKPARIRPRCRVSVFPRVIYFAKTS